MSAEQPIIPKEIAELSVFEPLCPGDSGIDLPIPDIQICPSGMVEQKIPQARWEGRWIEGEVEKFGADTVVFSRATRRTEEERKGVENGAE
jgi:hypothetical protein